MMNLESIVIKRDDLTIREEKEMFLLMDTFYDHMNEDIFLDDLNKKHYCILLKNKAGEIMGFSTQQILSFEIDGESIHGVFSGDTIIHKDYWGSMELFKDRKSVV